MKPDAYKVVSLSEGEGLFRDSKKMATVRGAYDRARDRSRYTGLAYVVVNKKMRVFKHGKQVKV